MAATLTYAQAEAETGINHWTLRRMAASGVLRVIRLGHRTTYIRRDELERVMKLFENKPSIARAQMRMAS